MEINNKMINVIEKDRIFQRFAPKYSNPLVKYEKNIPDRIMDKFLKEADVFDLAFFFIGFCRDTPTEFACRLDRLETYKNYSLPKNINVLSPGFWDAWQTKNVIQIMDYCKSWENYRFQE